MKTKIIIAAILLTASLVEAAPPKPRDDPSTWSIPIASESYLTFSWPSKVFLYPFLDVAGNQSARWGGSAIRWVQVASPLQRGTEANYFCEILPIDGKLVDWLKPWYQDFEKKPTSSNQVMWKPPALTKTKLKLGGRSIEAYTAQYSSKPLNTLVKNIDLRFTGQVWVFDIDKSRVILQADAYKESFNPASTLLSALSWSKKDNTNNSFKMCHVDQTAYRFHVCNVPPQCIIDWKVESDYMALWHVKLQAIETAQIKLREMYVAQASLEDYVNDRIKAVMATRGLPVDIFKIDIAGKKAYVAKGDVPLDDGSIRHVHLVCFKVDAFVVWWEMTASDTQFKAINEAILMKMVDSMAVWSVE